jgi:hypothetical protein
MLLVYGRKNDRNPHDNNISRHAVIEMLFLSAAVVHKKKAPAVEWMQ